MRQHSLLCALALGTVLLTFGAQPSAAQSIWFTQVPPQGFAGSSAQVVIDYIGAYGQDTLCDEGGFSCTYYPYDNRVVLGTFGVTVNGVVRTPTFTVTESESCTYGQAFTDPWRCQETGHATGTPYFSTSGTNTIVVSVNSGTPSATYSWTIPTSVQVTATPTSTTVGGGRSAQTAGFTVTNTGPAAAHFLLSAQCSGAALAATPACASTVSDVYVRPGETTPARIVFNTQPAAGSGTATLFASNPVGNATLGSASASITVTAPPYAIVTVPTFQRGATFERSLCPTFAVVPGVATQCGAIRVAHALPSVRTYGKSYAPTLAYYGDNVKGTYLVVNVTLPPSTPIPGTVALNVYQVSSTGVRGPLIATKSYAGGAWNANRSMRVSTGDLGAPYNTINTYDVEVQLDGASAGPYMRGQVAPVNRATSGFGNGWSLLGLEQLVMNQVNNSVLWIGGDGSTRQYISVRVAGNVTTYAAPAVDRPDSLYHDISTHEWRRALPHGANVFFDESGHHVRTVNRFGRATTFIYEAGTNGRLTAITVPGGLSYQVDYSNSSTVIVISQGGRVVRVNGGLGATGNFTVNNIVDPDGSTETFSYASSGPGAALTAWTDRRGTQTNFTWESSGASNDLGSAVTTVTTLNTVYLLDAGGNNLSNPPVAGPSQSSFSTVWGRGAASAAPAEDASAADYTYDGPRVEVADVASIWTDTLGAIVRTRDAYGRETIVEHGDPRFPGLATKVVNSANGYTVRAVYDAQGRLASKTEVNPHDDGRDATLVYTWDPTWDEVTSVTMPEGETTNFGVDAATGNRIWAENPNVAGTRTTYRYNGAGQIRAVQSPTANGVTPVDSIDAYDGLGNVARLLSPNLYLTTVSNDGLGRTTSVQQQITPGDQGTMTVHRTVYDIMSRPTAQLDSGPPLGAVASEWVWTNNYFNSVTGNLDSSSRSPSSGPVARLTTRWRYDELERARAEIAPDGRADSTVYDRAGNVAVHVTRNGDKLWSIYDALNRPVDRNSTAKSYAQTSPAVCRLGSGGPGPGTCYGTDMLPEYSLSSSGYQTFPSQLTIPAQTAHFTYDPATGQVQEGDNADAQVTRTYDASGAVKSETQRVRTVGSGVQSNTHVYAMTYGRDRNGRVTSIQLPTALQPRSTGGTVLGTNIQYGYDPNTGALATVRDALGHVTTAGYNARGERISLALPGASVTEGYDAEGQLMSSVGQSSAGIALRNTTFQYDARGKMLSMAGTTGWHETNSSIYSGLGYLVHNHSTSRDDASIQTFYSDEGFTMSPLADILSALTTTTYAYASGGGFVSNSGGSYTYTNRTTVFDALSGRLQSQTTGTRHDYFFYDSAGSTKYMSANDGATDHPVAEERASYYDAAGQLRATEFHSVSNDMALTAEDRNYRRVFEEYGYDALGRRVWVRARKDCDVPNASNVFLCRMGTVRRLIWDGSATLAEIQQPGGNTATTADMESDGALVSQQPWLGAYYDSNPFYGIALYAYGMNGTDHPVTVTRLFYQDRPIGNSVATIWEPFSVVPLWNAAGQLDNMVYTNGTQQFAPYTPARHHIIDFPHGRFAYYRNDVVAGSWHGSLLEDKHDASGLHDRRNRSYDPMTGRFTQEDPIGLAGGMNVYGFAGGDPVNFSDPSGLCPKDMGGNGATRTMSDCPEGSAGRRQYISGAVSTAPFSPLDLIPIGALASGVRGLLVGAVEEVAESAGAGVVANKVAGDAFRDKIADLFRQAGYGVRTEVAKKTPFGQRMIDIEVSRNGEVLGGIETKLGSGRYNAYQRAKDAALKLLHDYTVQVVR